MKDDDKRRRGPDRPDAEADDDVEILEVVGLDDEDGLPGRRGDRPDRPAPDAESHEVVLAFDLDQGEGEGPERPPQRQAPGRPAERRVRPAPSFLSADEREQFLRLQADYENLRKRVERERHEYEQNANATLVGRLLPVLDNFERALQADGTPGDGGSFREGVALIHRQMMQELRREGLTEIEALGRPFDPHVHDAVATQPSEVRTDQVVVEELQRGYLFRSRLLRPALVKVGLGGDESGGGEGR